MDADPWCWTLASGRRVLEVIDEEPEIKDQGSKEKKVTEGSVTFDHVCILVHSNTERGEGCIAGVYFGFPDVSFDRSDLFLRERPHGIEPFYQ